MFRERRILLLALVVLLSGTFIVWKGIPWGLDIGGGSRIALKLEACEAIITTTNTDPSYIRDNIVSPIENELKIPVRVLGSTEKKIVLEIGRNISENALRNILAGEEEVIGIEVKLNKVDKSTREDVIELLNYRVDVHGIKAASFRTLGEDLVLFEIPGVKVEEAIRLLGHPGRLEAYVGEELVYSGADIIDVYAVRPSMEGGGYDVPFRVNEEAAERFRNASVGKADWPLVFYLDRPVDSIILFSSELELRKPITYDENVRKFYDNLPFLSSNWVTGFHLHVPALKVPLGPLPKDIQNELRSYRGEHDINRIILLADNFDPNTIEWLENFYGKENIESDLIDKLIEICGVEAYPSIKIAGQLVTNPVITTGSSEDARRIRSLLTYTLPVSISVAWEESVSAPLGQAFLSEARNAALAAAVAIGAMLYVRYRRLQVAGLILVTALFEVIAVLGIASIARISIGLAEIGGLIAVIGTGVDHQIIITDEVLRGVVPRAQKPMSLKGRVRRAFSVIFAAAATTIAAMFLLFWLGFGAMRGFAIITILGVLASVLVTRPAYARIISILIARESSKEF